MKPLNVVVATALSAALLISCGGSNGLSSLSPTVAGSRPLSARSDTAGLARPFEAGPSFG